MTPLEHMAARVATDPFFLAFALAGYAQRHGLTGADLCARLACTPETLAAVKLCRCPDHADEVREIAGWFGVDAGELSRAVWG